MKGFAIRRKLAMLVAAVVTVVGVGTMQGSSATGTKSRSYVVYDYATESVLSNAAYTLTLSEQYSSTYSVIPPDTRVDYENSGVVQLSTNSSIGTGFIVGDHTIVTAAHCIFDETTASYGTNMRIKLYDDNGTLEKTLTKSNTTIQAHVPEYYVHTPIHEDNFQYDYALLNVSEDLSKYEHFQLGEVLKSAAYSTTIPVSACGFSTGTLKIGEGTLMNIKDLYFTYNTDVEAGDSGGPVFVSSMYAVGTDVVELNTVIGIHTYGVTTFNQGNLITPEIRQFCLNNPNKSY